MNLVICDILADGCRQAASWVTRQANRLRGRNLQPPSSFITYDFMHGLGRRPARQLLDEMSETMGRYTSHSSPDHAWLLLDFGGDNDPNLNRAYDEFCRAYGRRVETLVGYSHSRSSLEAFRWRTRLDAIDEALCRVELFRDSPTLLGERVSLQLSWKFSWLDPLTGAVLPLQEAWPTVDIRQPDCSSVLLNLGGTSSASLWWLFPFEAVNAESSAYIAALQAALPFRLSNKHWRVWSRDRKKEWRPRKCNPLAPLAEPENATH